MTTIFITGATGFLGKPFLKALLRQPGNLVHVLIRKGRHGSVQARLEAMGLEDPNLIPVEGDVTDPAILNHPDLPDHCDEFWHLASLTEFPEDKRPQLETINIGGTRIALDLAERLRTKRFFHVSTAYVAGLHQDPVPEDGLLPNPEFRNPYEETKYLSEALVRKSALPFVIVRPSIIVGDSQTGEVDSDKMMYGVAKAYYIAARLARTKADRTGRPIQTCHVWADSAVAHNFICIDDVLHMMMAIRDHGNIGATYHCAHQNNVPHRQLQDAIKAVLQADFFDLQKYRDMEGERKNPVQHFLNKRLAVYRNYFLTPNPVFQIDNIMAVLDGWQPTEITTTKLRFLIQRYAETRLF